MHLMNNAVLRVPKPVNEPIHDYAPASPERARIKSALTEIAGKKIEIPLIICGKEIKQTISARW